jgi:hypothetical protein
MRDEGIVHAFDFATRRSSPIWLLLRPGAKLNEGLANVGGLICQLEDEAALIVEAGRKTLCI